MSESSKGIQAVVNKRAGETEKVIIAEVREVIRRAFREGYELGVAIGRLEGVKLAEEAIDKNLAEGG